MKTRTILMTLALCLVGISVAVADDANMGTWKLNEAKSTLPAGDSVKVTVDGTDKDGKAVHSEWTGKFDGKDYPLTGDPGMNARSYKRIDAQTLMLTGKKDGKVISEGRIVVSADGKTRTVKLSATDSAGKKLKSTAVYDKQ